MAPHQRPRNQSFDSREPFQEDRSLRFRSATGTFSFMNPTRARFEYIVDNSGILRPLAQALHPSSGADGSAEYQSLSTERRGDSHETESLLGAQSRDSVSFLWRSRDNRKGRHALLVRPSRDSREGKTQSLPPRTNTLLATAQGIKVMFTRFPYWDVSWLVAVTFTLGSLIWVINGFFVVLSITEPHSKFPFQISHAGGWSAFVGATVFFGASLLMMVEVLSANPTGCFGWEVDQTSNNGDTKTEARPSECEHHHQGNRENIVGDGTEEDGSVEQGSYPPSKGSSQQWLPSWHDLKNYYLYETSFIACSIQMTASTLFWVSKFLAIPQISAQASNSVLIGGYYVPTVIGGCGFIVSSTLLMLETQPRWYIPAPGVLGWHVCFWKLVGSIGFTISGGLGPFRYADQGAYYQSSISSFWGSWAILLGSLIQWFESLDKHPVVEEGSNSTSEWQSSEAKGYE
jgi:hypothetical protein